MKWYTHVLKNCFDFKTRSSRTEFWMFNVINLVISIVLALFDGALGLYDAQSGFGLLSTIYGLVVLLPSLAVLVRRLHDINFRGYWALLLLIPLVGMIIILIMACFKSQEGENRFGNSPHDTFDNNDGNVIQS